MRLSPKPVSIAVRLAGLALLLASLPGCRLATGSAAVSQVRVIDASPDAPAIDIYQSGSSLAHNLGFGTITSYIPISPGASLITANTAGSKQILTSARSRYAAAAQYTVLIGNAASSLQQTVLLDQNQSAPAGQVSLRVLDQATNLGVGIDVYLVPAGESVATIRPLLTGALFGTNSGYINLPAGIYTVVLLPAGTTVTNATVPLYTGTKTIYSAGAARSIILLDQPAIAPASLQVVTANDFDPPEASN
jgi:hypothetical protein